METTRIFTRAIIIITLLLIPTLFIVNMCADTASVITKEFSPSSLLKKYEYFKDLSASIDEKRATIEVYKSQISGIKDQEGFQYQQTQAEMIGLISMHNSLCKEYNSGMSKFNYSFCNKGTLQ